MYTIYYAESGRVDDVYGSQIARESYLDLDPASVHVGANLWQFHRVADSCTCAPQLPYETAIGWRPHGPTPVFIGPCRFP